MTDEEGRFEFTSRKEPFSVAARDAATGRVGVVDIVPPESGDVWRDIELAPAPGTIEGIVRSRGTASVADVRVGITRGEGFIRITRTDAGGRFRFDHVPNGEWQGGVLESDWDPVFVQIWPKVEEGSRFRVVVSGSTPVAVETWRASG